MLAAVFVLALGMASGARAGVFPFVVEFSGSDYFILVDGNGDGPGPGDCRYRILLADSNPFDFPNIRIEAVQDANTPLNLCSGEYLGDLFLGSDESSDFAEVDLETTDMASGSVATPPTPLAGFRYYPPMEVELIHEFGGAPDGFPMSITEVRISGSEDELLFTMRPCNDGNNPALEIRQVGGLSVLVGLEEYGPPGDPTHLRMSSLPFETAPLGALVMRDVYFPIDNRTLTASVGEHEVLEVPIDGLATCGRHAAAPAASQWALAGLMIALLVLGTAALGSWDRFYRGLPRL
jgi:hypothetical protein